MDRVGILLMRDYLNLLKEIFNYLQVHCLEFYRKFIGIPAFLMEI